MKRKLVFLAGCLLLAAFLTGCGLTSKQIVKTQSFGTGKLKLISEKIKFFEKKRDI
jgi:hypothetical protein